MVRSPSSTPEAGGEGLIAEAGLTRPRPLSSDAIEALLSVEPGAETAGRESVHVPGFGAYRVAAFEDNGTRTVYGVPQGSVDAALDRTAWTTAVVVIIGVLITAGLMAVIIHRQLRDLRDVARTAREVTDLELSAGKPELALRVPAELAVPGTEVGDVGAAVNRMLDHVGTALDERYRGTEQMRRFVADASHELRTPIATIRGWADLTRPYREELPTEVTTSLAKIDIGAMRMSSLVDDLLLLARLEAGRQPTNACVHTPPDTQVRVSAAAARKPVAGKTPSDVVVVRISDDGPGIPPEIRDTVFDRFVRGDPARTREAGAKGGSSGLGLAIAAGLVELMHGSITMSSSEAGTVFELRLPAAGTDGPLSPASSTERR